MALTSAEKMRAKRARDRAKRVAEEALNPKPPLAPKSNLVLLRSRTADPSEPIEPPTHEEMVLILAREARCPSPMGGVAVGAARALLELLPKKTDPLRDLTIDELRVLAARRTEEARRPVASEITSPGRPTDAPNR